MKQESLTSYISAAILSLALAAISIVYFSTGNVPDALGQSMGFGAESCVASTTQRILGNQASTQLLATSSRRAYAEIKNYITATNTISLAVNGAAATTNNGISLGNGTSTVPQRYAFGLNTDLPYTGAITAISNNGSTSVEVLDCVYTR